MSSTYDPARQPSTLGAALLSELMAAGITGPALVAALDRCLLASADADATTRREIEDRRAANRERQQRHRERKKTATSTVVTVSNVTSRYDLTDADDFSRAAPALRANAVLPAIIRQPRDVARACPADFMPNEAHYDYAAKLGRSKEWCDEMAIEMREWSQSNSNRAVARKPKWHLAFLGWMRREAKKTTGKNHETSISTAARTLGGASFAPAPRPVLDRPSEPPLRAISKG